MSELKPRRRLSSNHPNHPKPMKKPLVNYPSNSVQRPLSDPITFTPSFADLITSSFPPSLPKTSSKPGTMEEGMKSLISVYNRLQDLQTNVGRSAFQGINLNLPQIVVVGTQSAGKSSVLEGLVGRDFLPRGTGIVTRVPLVLQLVHTSKGDVQEIGEDEAEVVQEWGEFLHKKGERFYNFDQIREEIESNTNELAGYNKGVIDLPINLSIHSPRVVNLTLVDLPETTRNPVGDQPDDIEIQIKEMILKYITPENAVILAVSPANQDISTSEAIQMAQKLDPKGARTLAVLTKLDLMDAGTDATQVLENRVIKVKLGYIGVVNRSQQNINDKKPIKDCIADEKLFLSKTYPHLAAKCGMPYLARSLHEILMAHLKTYLPQYKGVINKKMAEQGAILSALGDPISAENRDMLLLQLIRKFATDFCNRVDGQVIVSSADFKPENVKLTGGAKINHDIFYGSFKADLHDIAPLNGVSLKYIRHILRETTGLQAHVFVSDEAFFKLVRNEVKRLEAPSVTCVEMVHDELYSLMETCGPDCKRDFERFPRLYQEIVRVASELLWSKKEKTLGFVKASVDIHTAYINTHHKGFSKEAAKLLEAQQRRRIELEDAKKKEAAELAEKNGGGVVEEPGEGDEEEVSEDWIGGSGDAGKMLKKMAKITQLVLNVVPKEDQEMEDCKLMRDLTTKYFKLIKDAVDDMVPKAIVRELIQPVKEEIQSVLQRELATSEAVKDLLKESHSTEEHRKEVARTLAALRKAASIVNDVRDFSF